MPVSRMRMRPWLENMIESKCINGMAWVDKEKTMFSVPWKHAARHGWEMDKDACLFKKWAIHTGKYTEGQTCDPKTWKANFRCAMNSLPDIEEVKDKSINKGQQAMRIFRMLPVSKSRDRRRKTKAKLSKKNSTAKMEEDSDYSDTQFSQNTSLSEEPTFNRSEHVAFEPWKQDPECDSDDAFSTDTEIMTLCNRFQLSPDYNHDYSESKSELQHLLNAESSILDKILGPDADITISSLFTDQSSSDETEENVNYTIMGNVQPSLKLWADLF